MIQISIVGLIFFLAVALVIALLLSAGARTAFANFFLGLGYLIQAGFLGIRNMLRTAAPAAGAAAGGVATIAGRVFMVFMIIALLLLLAILAIYVMVVVGLIKIGFAIGHGEAALILIVLFITWGFLSAIPYWGPLRPLVRIRQWVVLPAVGGLSVFLIGCLIWWVFGNISPRGQSSLERSASNKAEETWNGLDKSSLQSESESGIFARVNKGTRVYNSKNQPFSSLKEGDMVLVLNTEGEKKSKESEGKIFIMLPNDDGEFIGGKRGYIPSRIIDWDWKKPTGNSPEKTDGSGKKPGTDPKGKKEGGRIKTTKDLPTFEVVHKGVTIHSIRMDMKRGEYEFNQPVDVFIGSNPIPKEKDGSKLTLDRDEKMVLINAKGKPLEVTF